MSSSSKVDAAESAPQESAEAVKELVKREDSKGENDDDEEFIEGGGSWLFGEEAEEAPPEYPIESLHMDHASVIAEGKTWPGFTPLYDRFDALPPKEASTTTSSSAATPPHQHSLTVSYRNKRHSLWGHKLWNAAKYLVKRMEQGCIDVTGKSVLELGAGLGVPSLSAFQNGASLVVVTDYPDEDLLDIIQRNVDENCKEEEGHRRIIKVEPLLWGKKEHMDKALAHTHGKGFDIVLLSDILFNHVCNEDLADTVAATLSWRANTTSSTPPVAYCVFSHHRAHKQMEDFEFFDMCISKGLYYEQIDQEEYPLMFPEDRGPESVRQPVKVYRLTRYIPAPSAFAPPSDTGSEAPYRSSIASHRASPALKSEEARVDVVIQGTSLPQCLLSAALSCAGFRVLHCDAAGYYGGAYATLSLVELHALLRDRPGALSTYAIGNHSHDSTSVCGVPVEWQAKVMINTLEELADTVPGTEKQSTQLPQKGSQEASLASRLLVDLLPQSFCTRGDVIQQLLDSKLTNYVEFQFLDRFLLLQVEPKEGGGMPLHVQDYPLTRSGFFATPTSSLSLMEKRRVMQLVKALEPVLVEGFHAANASVNSEVATPTAEPHTPEAIPCFVQQCWDAYHKAQPSPHHPGSHVDPEPSSSESSPSFRELLQAKFNLSENALDVITFFGMLEPATAVSSASSPLDRTVLLHRQTLTAIGRFHAPTPFLQPLYGVGELPQAMTRVAAVHGAVFALDRSVQRVVWKETHGEEKLFAVLSNNGQHVETKVVVLPEGEGGQVPLRLHDFEHVRAIEAARAAGRLSEVETVLPPSAHTTSSGYARVVCVLSRPLFRSAHLPPPLNASSHNNPSEEEEDESLTRETVTPGSGKASPAGPCTVAALCRLPRGDAEGEAVAVHIAQHSAATQQAPAKKSHTTPSEEEEEEEEVVVLHFTASASQTSPQALYQLVQRYFFSEAAAPDGHHTHEVIRTLRPIALAHIRFAAYFAVDSNAIARHSAPITRVGDFPSETRHTHEFALTERRKVAHANAQQRLHLSHTARSAGDDSSARENADDETSPASIAGCRRKAEELSASAAVLALPQLPRAWMDDSSAVTMAKHAFEAVVKRLSNSTTKNIFLEAPSREVPS